MAAAVRTVHGRATHARELAHEQITDPHAIEAIIRGLSSDQARVRFGSAKALRRLSEQQPDLLYPRFDFFVGLLDHPNKILQWEAAFVLSQLARVDHVNKFDAVFEKYFAPIAGPVMITAANVIQGGARIARAKPELADPICTGVLKVSRARYRTPECRNIAIGHAIAALGQFLDLLTDPGPALRFVGKQLKNPRPATARKAADLLRRHPAAAATGPARAVRPARAQRR